MSEVTADDVARYRAWVAEGERVRRRSEELEAHDRELLAEARSLLRDLVNDEVVVIEWMPAVRAFLARVDSQDVRGAASPGQDTSLAGRGSAKSAATTEPARERAEALVLREWEIDNGTMVRDVEAALVAHAREAAAAMRDAAAEAAKGTCTCAPFWADYNRTDPQCGAHDAEETIAALPLPGDAK